jgi:hypothetical protein
MDGAGRYVFEKLAEEIPVQAELIEVEEVDTPADMSRAEAAVSAWDFDGGYLSPNLSK